jgi:hypothetical protein
LHRLIDDAEQLGGQGVQVQLVAKPSTERLHGLDLAELDEDVGSEVEELLRYQTGRLACQSLRCLMVTSV